MKYLAAGLLTAMAVFSLARPARAQSLQATVDRNQIAVTEQIVLTVAIEGAEGVLR